MIAFNLSNRIIGFRWYLLTGDTYDLRLVSEFCGCEVGAGIVN